MPPALTQGGFLKPGFTNVSLHLWQHGQEEVNNLLDKFFFVLCHTASLEKIASFL